MDKTMELFREGKVAEAVKEFDTTRKFKVMTAGEAAMEVRFRMLVEQVDILRKLISDLRLLIALDECECDASLMNTELCGRCILLGIIDTNLAKIGEEREHGKPA